MKRVVLVLSTLLVGGVGMAQVGSEPAPGQSVEREQIEPLPVTLWRPASSGCPAGEVQLVAGKIRLFTTTTFEATPGVDMPSSSAKGCRFLAEIGSAGIEMRPGVTETELLHKLLTIVISQLGETYQCGELKDCLEVLQNRARQQAATTVSRVNP